jgi:hypothetical protein
VSSVPPGEADGGKRREERSDGVLGGGHGVTGEGKEGKSTRAHQSSLYIILSITGTAYRNSHAYTCSNQKASIPQLQRFPSIIQACLDLDCYMSLTCAQSQTRRWMQLALPRSWTLKSCRDG